MPPKHAPIPGDPEAIRRLLRQPETATVLTALQARDGDQVKAAAEAALKGDAAALNLLLADLSRDPKAKRAMEKLDHSSR